MKRRSPAPRSTVPKGKPAPRVRTPLPPRIPRAPLPSRTERRLPPHRIDSRPPPARKVAHIIDDREGSLVDVLDSLLNQGVVLDAELVLALANVDLVYLRLSAILVAADRVLPRRG